MEFGAAAPRHSLHWSYDCGSSGGTHDGGCDETGEQRQRERSHHGEDLDLEEQAKAVQSLREIIDVRRVGGGHEVKIIAGMEEDHVLPEGDEDHEQNRAGEEVRNRTVGREERHDLCPASIGRWPNAAEDMDVRVQSSAQHEEE